MVVCKATGDPQNDDQLVEAYGYGVRIGGVVLTIYEHAEHTTITVGDAVLISTSGSDASFDPDIDPIYIIDGERATKRQVCRPIQTHRYRRGIQEMLLQPFTAQQAL